MSISQVTLNRPNDLSGRAIKAANEYYDDFLADHYSWMAGGHTKAVASQQSILIELGLQPTGSGSALDLGCGPGFQSLALARMGFQVTALDTSRKLLAELVMHCGQRAVTPVKGDIRDAIALVPPGFAAAVCMGDTLTHLPSQESVARIFADLSRLLAKGGSLVLSFRDLTTELKGTERFIPVRNDADRIATCFLEYEAKAVIVHDLIHVHRGASWQLHTNSYRKLRLSPGWVIGCLEACGFTVRRSKKIDQMSVIAAVLNEPAH
jgi:SAM-dependent methyltransferase